MTPSEKIDQYIEKTNDWRGEVIKEIRKIVHEVEPDTEEEWKWNSPVFSHHGMVCSPGAFKNHVGLNFFQGAHLKDTNNLFNSSMESKNARSINYKKGDPLKENDLRELIKSAVAYNASKC
jgi:hypothetical protein